MHQKRVKIFSDSSNISLEKEINAFLANESGRIHIFHITHRESGEGLLRKTVITIWYYLKEDKGNKKGEYIPY